VLLLGVIPPLALIVNPAGDALYVPPVYAPVPVSVTGCAVLIDLQNGVPAYRMVYLHN